LGKAVEYASWRAKEPGLDVAPPGVDLDAVHALTGGDGPLAVADAVQLAGAAGLRVAPSVVVGDADAAVAAAEELGGIVALKAVRRRAGAKTEASGVALDVYGAEDARRTYERMVATLGEELMADVLVQAMVPPGVDVAVRVVPAPVVGAAVEIGPGGAAAHLLGPTARMVLPATDVAIADLVAASGMADALTPSGCAALADVIARLAYVAEEVPEVVRFELNPVIVSEAGAWCTDVAAEVAPEVPGPPESIRRLDS
jgi:hypothetical protein